MIHAGVDPGLSGAIAILDGEQLVDVVDMPTAARWLTSRGHVKEVDPGGCIRCFDAARVKGVAEVAIERVHAMPGQGVTSMFSFGRSLGVVETAATTCGRVVWYRPQQWQAKYTLCGKGGKDYYREECMRLWPEHADLFKRKRDSGRADAALIALHNYIERGRGREGWQTLERSHVCARRRAV